MMSGRFVLESLAPGAPDVSPYLLLPTRRLEEVQEAMRMRVTEVHAHSTEQQHSMGVTNSERAGAA